MLLFLLTARGDMSVVACAISLTCSFILPIIISLIGRASDKKTVKEPDLVWKRMLELDDPLHPWAPTYSK